MMRAIFGGVVIAEGEDVRVVEGMTYFRLADVDMDRLFASPTTSRCFWKGKATYWHVDSGSEVAKNAAFAYRRPWPLARRLVADRIAFWQGVHVVPC